MKDLSSGANERPRQVLQRDVRKQVVCSTESRGFGAVSQASTELDHRQRPTREWFFLPCHHSREMSSRLVAMRLLGPGIALQMVRLSTAALSDIRQDEKTFPASGGTARRSTLLSGAADDQALLA